MRVLLITDQYPPEIRSISAMIRELAEGLTDRGHEVTVISSYPRPQFSAGAVSDTPAHMRRPGLTVHRVRTFHYRRSYALRGLGELLMPFVFLVQSLFTMPRRPDVVLMYSPPLTLTILCRLIKWVTGARFILNVQDIFPQNALDLGIIRSGALRRLFERIERKAYRAADHITTHSVTNARFLIDRKGVPAEKLSTIYNWLDLAAYEQAQPTGVYRRTFGVENKFVFLLGGFIGPSQQLDFVLRVAEAVRGNPDICFLILGEGTEKERLLDIKRQRQLDNVKVFSLIPREAYPALVKEMDVGLACLSSRNTTPVYPGKIVGFMACAKPVLAFLHAASDGHAIIRDAGCGYSAISGDLEAATALVTKMYAERAQLAEQGRRGFAFASRYFGRDQGIDALDRAMRPGAGRDAVAVSAY